MSKPILLTTNEIGEDVRTTMREPELRVLPDYTEMMDPQPSASARPLSSLQRSPFHSTPTHMAYFLFYAMFSASSHRAHAHFHLVIPCACSFFPTSNKGSRPYVQSLAPCWMWGLAGCIREGSILGHLPHFLPDTGNKTHLFNIMW